MAHQSVESPREAPPPPRDAISLSRNEEIQDDMVAPFVWPSSEPAKTSSPAKAPSSVELLSPPLSFSDDGASIEDEMEIDNSTFKKSDNDFVPKEGMEFESLEEFERLYNNFAASEGSTIRIRRTTNFPHTDKIRYRQYVCSCAGFYEENKSNDTVNLDSEKTRRRTSTRRTGCPVTITVSNKKGIWKVQTIVKEHNHVLVSPNSRIHLRKRGGMPFVAKKLVEKFSETDLPIGRVADIINCDTSINVSQRDCWNHRRDIRRKNLDSGDANAVLHYCIEKSQDSNFFYEIQTDDEDRMVNFFWIDSTARQYYERFGDVLVFDTTYKTNKYGSPLGNFVGVNNHNQSIMFGFALLQNEQEETFIWLFKTWLRAVGGKLPISILTDQDRAIQNAIAKVFPTVTHRFCLWHIMQKFPEHYGSLYKENSPFFRDLKNCLYDPISTEQFDNEWKKIMKDYKLMEDKWLNNLFDIRRSWVPVYNCTIFYAGMNTTQRCESIHSFFDSFLNKGTTLREFVVKYERALESRYRSEHEERFASIYKNPILQVKSPLEEQAANVYTRKIFNEFQVELKESLKLRKEKMEKSGFSRKYKVSNFHNSNGAFVVNFDVETKEVSCECHLFEFKGILCRHALTIFNKKDVASVPSKYILPRWTKKAGEGIYIPLFKKVGDESSIVSDLKFNDMMSRLRAYMHVSTNARDFVMETLDRAIKGIFNLQLEENQEVNKSATIITGCVEGSVEQSSIANPSITKTKGRRREDVGVSKNGRFKSDLEVRIENSKQQKRQCKNCGQHGHYSSTCERRKQAGVMENAHAKD